jgi:DNA polymerase III alpha subunit (gram-positive type)
MEKAIFWCDTETTGLSPERNFIIQIAYVIKRAGDILIEKNIKFRVDDLSKFEIEDMALAVNRTTREELEKFQLESEAIKEIIADLDGIEGKFIFAGYNAPFDVAFVKTMMSRHGYDFDKYFEGVYDVLEVVRRARREGTVNFSNPSNKQSVIAENFGITGEFHDAMVDIKTCIAINKKIADIYKEKNSK